MRKILKGKSLLMMRKILEEKVFSFEEFLMNLLLLLNEIFKGTRNSPLRVNEARNY